MTDTHQAEKKNKKSKKHRGYAFVVYEREKDMRGKLDHIPHPAALVRSNVWFCKDVALTLARLISFIVICPAQGILSMGSMTDNRALLALRE